MGENGRAVAEGAPLRVIVCHEVPLVRGGLRAAIDAESDMEVVAESADVESVPSLVNELNPDVIVTDIAGDGGRALDVVRSIKSSSPSPKVLILTTQSSGEFFPVAMRAGADGYLTRESEPVEVVNAIRSLNRGQNYVNASIITLMVNTYVCRVRGGGLEDPYDVLTDREREILCLAAAGRTNKEIAGILHLSKQTVHNLRARLMDKLGLHDRMELLKYAIRRGIVSTKDL